MTKPSSWPAIEAPATPRDSFDSASLRPQPQRNHPEHIHKIERVELLECLNERDAAGNVIMDTLDDFNPLADIRAEYEEVKELQKKIYKHDKGLFDFDFFIDNKFKPETIKRIIHDIKVGINVNLAFSGRKIEEFTQPAKQAQRRPAQRKKARTAEIWPLMGVHSWGTKHGGAWRLSVLFSSLDHNENCNHAAGVCYGGSGKIEREALEAAAIELGVKRSTFYTWLADAKKFGIFSGDGKFLYMASQQKIAEILFCNTIDQRKATIPLKLLFKAGWKDVVWSAYIKVNHNKKNISDKTLEGITGVPQRTQRRLNTHVKRKKNFALTQVDGTTGNLEAAKDNSQHKGYFVFNRQVAYSLPARRSVNDTYAKNSGKGRRYVILAKLNNLSVYGLYKNGNHPFYSLQQATNSETDLTKLFYENNKKDTKKAARVLQPLTRGKKSPREIYILQSQKYKCGVWDVGHVGAGISV